MAGREPPEPRPRMGPGVAKELSGVLWDQGIVSHDLGVSRTSGLQTAVCKGRAQSWGLHSISVSNCLRELLCPASRATSGGQRVAPHHRREGC